MLELNCISLNQIPLFLNLLCKWENLIVLIYKHLYYSLGIGAVTYIQLQELGIIRDDSWMKSFCRKNHSHHQAGLLAKSLEYQNRSWLKCLNFVRGIIETLKFLVSSFTKTRQALESLLAIHIYIISYLCRFIMSIRPDVLTSSQMVYKATY